MAQAFGEDDFESGVILFDDLFWRQANKKPFASTDQSRLGTYSMKSVLDRQDVDPNRRRRSEVTYAPSAGINWPENPQPDGEVWARVSIMVASSSLNSTRTSWNVQFHEGQPLPGLVAGEAHTRQFAPFLFGVKPVTNEWYLVQHSDSRLDTFDPNNPIGAAEFRRTYTFDPIVGDTWYDFIFNIKWAHSNGMGGKTRIWQNGTLIHDISDASPQGGRNFYNDTRGPYWKMGQYRDWGSGTIVTDVVDIGTVWHDEFKFAGDDATYADMVLPTGGTPPSVIANAPTSFSVTA